MLTQTAGNPLSIPYGFTRPAVDLVFGKGSVYSDSVSATYTEGRKPQEAVGEALVASLRTKRWELVKEACRVSLEREIDTPAERKMLEFVKFAGDDPKLTWVYLGKTPVCVFTEPRSVNQGRKCIFYFHFLQIDNEKRNET